MWEGLAAGLVHPISPPEAKQESAGPADSLTRVAWQLFWKDLAKLLRDLTSHGILSPEVAASGHFMGDLTLGVSSKLSSTHIHLILCSLSVYSLHMGLVTSKKIHRDCMNF